MTVMVSLFFCGTLFILASFILTFIKLMYKSQLDTKLFVILLILGIIFMSLGYLVSKQYDAEPKSNEINHIVK